MLRKEVELGTSPQGSCLTLGTEEDRYPRTGAKAAAHVAPKGRCWVRLEDRLRETIGHGARALGRYSPGHQGPRGKLAGTETLEGRTQEKGKNVRGVEVHQKINKGALTGVTQLVEHRLQKEISKLVRFPVRTHAWIAGQVPG